MATSVDIGGLQFVCVQMKDADFSDIAAIYVILCVGQGGSWTVLDVGQSGELGQRIDSHDRKACWERKCVSGNIWVCVYPMPTSRHSKEQRLQVEKRLREQYRPLCGTR